jgi:methionine sulfoxide reductase heme-binding subunit
VYPWQNRAGQLSPLKLTMFVALFLPGAWIIAQWWLGMLAPKPVTEAIHQSGDWAVRFVLITLAVTPLRRIANWPRLILVRRMLGLAALAYACVHLVLYVVDQKYDLAKVVSEIVLRIYLTIGFAALVALVALGATSTDAAIRRLGGPRWIRLHKAVYAIGVLALVHFFLQSKIDVTQAVLMSGFFVFLMGYRLMHHYGWRSEPGPLAALAGAAALLTALIEAAWYGLATGVPALMVLAANLDFDIAIRPAWWVLAAGLAVVGLNVVRLGLGGTGTTAKRQRRDVRRPATASVKAA